MAFNGRKLTVNWHLEKNCNYKCKFCYASFNHVYNITDYHNGLKMINMIKNYGIYKINFAGGEPLLNNYIGDYIQYSKEIGLKTSIITNGSKLTNKWLNTHSKYIDQIGISCDSLSNDTNTMIGRGFGNHVEITQRAIQRINILNKKENINIKTKINTVLLKHNYNENWNDFIINNNIDRWKVLKILKIKGENDHVYDELSITDNQFDIFLNNHKELISKKILIKENNDDMEESYMMISPDGKFYQNKDNKYIYSDKIVDVGIDWALSQTGFDMHKFINRKGEYSL